MSDKKLPEMELARSVAKTLDLLTDSKICEAAGEYMIGFEEYLSKQGIPHAQITFAASVPARTKDEEIEVKRGVSLLPSVDVSAIFNGIREELRNRALEYAESHVEITNKMLVMWQSMHDGGKEEADLLADQFKIAVAVVSFIRQWGLHFAPHLAGYHNPHTCEGAKYMDCFEMLCTNDLIQERMRQTAYFSNLLEYVMEEPE